MKKVNILATGFTILGKDRLKDLTMILLLLSQKWNQNDSIIKVFLFLYSDEVGRLGSEIISMSEENIKGSLDSILMKESLNKMEEQIAKERMENEENRKTLEEKIEKLDVQIKDMTEQNNTLSDDIDKLRNENENKDQKLQKAWGERNSSGENAGEF